MHCSRAFQNEPSAATPKRSGLPSLPYREADFADAGRRVCLLDSATVMAAGSALQARQSRVRALPRMVTGEAQRGRVQYSNQLPRLASLHRRVRDTPHPTSEALAA